jgi:thioredoxin reductase (NADPH)
MGGETGKFDVIILGGGPAGLAAAMWSAELGLRSIVLEKNAEFGGQLHWIHTPILNYPGVKSRNGVEFLSKLLKQLGKKAFESRTNSEITHIDLKKRMLSLSNGESLQAKALVIATGVRRRTLGVEGEGDFVGRGLLETGQRDRHLLAGKRLMIVGGGDAAFENAAVLSEYAEQVFLLHRRQTFTARKDFVDKVIDNPRIEIIREAVVKRLTGRDRLEGVEYLDSKTGSVKSISIDTLLIRIGVMPNTEMFQGLELDGKGYILVNAACKTSVDGVFAIGDVANPISPTISTAVGMGSTAVKAIRFQLSHR